MKFKKSIASIMSGAIMLSSAFCNSIPLNPDYDTMVSYAVSMTADDAIAWAKSQVGIPIDKDGGPIDQPYQCVDLIFAYYKYLGVPIVSGNGVDFASNALPDGWARFQGVQPQKGDILVYGANAENPYGHVAIYESDYSTYHQNAGNYYVTNITTVRYDGFTTPYWGVIRPNWSNVVTPSKPTITATPSTADKETSFTWSPCSNTDWYDLRIYNEGSEEALLYFTKLESTNYSVALPEGNYYASIASVNQNGNYTFSDATPIFTVKPAPIDGQLIITPDAATGKTAIEWSIDKNATKLQLTITGENTEALIVPVDAAEVSGKTSVLLENDTYTAVLASIDANGKETNIDTIKFVVDGKQTWTYSSQLPETVTADKYEIEYKNIFEKIQTTSPGEEWTDNGFAKNEWVNKGNPYTSETPLETSDTRAFVRSYYYHWCIPGAAKNSEGNYETRDQFVHYDEIGLPNDFVVVKDTGDDEGHTYYLLTWGEGGADVYCKSGEQCDGSSEVHDYKCRAWYKHYVYQDKEKQVLNRYTKESEWASEADAAAASVTIRYKENSGTSDGISGDVNGDTAIDLKDVVLIRRYIAGGWDVELDTSTADVNKDGAVDLKDVVLIRRYIAGGWDVELK